MCALPRRHGASGRGVGTFGTRRTAWHDRGRDDADQRARPGDARRFDLRPWPDGVGSHRVRPPVGDAVTVPAPLSRSVSLTIDGKKVTVPEGATLLEACKVNGIDTPTFCWAENLTPVNV